MTVTPSNHSLTNPAREFLAGARDTLPLILGAIPFGLIFGTLAQSSGVSAAATLAMSAVVFAGSSQFIAIGLIAAGTALPLILLTTFVVNLRHLLYAASLVPYVRLLPQRWKIPIAFWLTDETFAVAIRRYTAPQPGPYPHWYYLGSALFMYGNWFLCTWLGLTVGQMIPNAASWGLDFAMVATFIGMTVPYITTRPMVAAVAVAGSSALLTHGLPHQLGLMVAVLLGAAAGMLVERFQQKPRGDIDHE
ncbi:MAG: AzlC family ABC transporter permease [Cyanobacteria bacterium Co-bin8]|nr:AzlC family ABC transporter permease [Cyanobacteria bacterium Co-bin8]